MRPRAPFFVLTAVAMLALQLPTAAAQETPQRHLHLVFDGTGQQSDPCHTGDSTGELIIGEHYDLLACVMDADESPTSTTTDGATSLRWSIEPGDGQAVTRFAEPPPSETETGLAIARLEAVRPGNDFVTVEFCDPSGRCGVDFGLPAASLQARVVACTGCDAQCGDQVDNDGDGATDFPDDSGCGSEGDNDERPSCPPNTICDFGPPPSRSVTTQTTIGVRSKDRFRPRKVRVSGIARSS
ncbi:MAG: hypothetical protein QOK47_192 [Actinomycetota bacterium]|jgi:hypothetical protein|nr:hypothetical protein [Actinomycetota bacterium]